MTGTDETALLPLEVRAVDEAQRIATMLVCKYGETTGRLARPERFLPGAFTRSVTERGARIPFTSRHTGGSGKIERSWMIARPVRWQHDDDAELRAVLRFFDTPDGWDAFCSARDGELDGASVGFRAVTERSGDDGAREIAEARLHHVALLNRAADVPAYDEPRLLEVRSAAEAATVQALLAVTWDPQLAEQNVADELARLAGRGSDWERLHAPGLSVPRRRPRDSRRD